MTPSSVMEATIEEPSEVLVSRRFISEYYRRGEYIKQLQMTVYVAFIWALIATLLWLWGPR